MRSRCSWRNSPSVENIYVQQECGGSSHRERCVQGATLRIWGTSSLVSRNAEDAGSQLRCAPRWCKVIHILIREFVLTVLC